MKSSYHRIIPIDLGNGVSIDRLAVADLCDLSDFARPQDALGKGVGEEVPHNSHYLSRLSVPKEARRRGIAREIMTELCADADAECATIYLGVLASAADGPTYEQLASFYESFGFVQNGGIIWHRAPALCDDCPPPDYPTDKTRCKPCPRRAAA